MPEKHVSNRVQISSHHSTMQSKIKIHLARISTALFLIGAHMFANAGNPAGPYLVWSDLENGHNSSLSRILAKYANSAEGDNFCGGVAAGPIIYMKNRPKGITNELIADAMVHKNSVQKQKLLSIMENYKNKEEGIDAGIDGIVIFTSEKGGQLISLDAKGKIKSIRFTGFVNSATLVVQDICKVNPRVFRR